MEKIGSRAVAKVSLLAVTHRTLDADCLTALAEYRTRR